jgi:hypothetical protein
LELSLVIKVNTLDLLSEFLPMYLYFIKYAECIRENRTFRKTSRIFQQ